MQKKKRISILVLAIGIICLIIINLSGKDNTIMQDNVTIAMTLDGNDINSFPNKGLYKVNVSCENAEGKWLYDEWKLGIEKIEKASATCNVNFTTINKSYLNNYITTLVGQTQGDGQVVQENGYRYEGKNPNNYIWFNNELWRIIGVFDSASHGQSGKNLVKVIRNKPIGSYTLEESRANNWHNSDVYILLNSYFYKKLDGTNSGSCLGNASTTGDSFNNNCNYQANGINDIYRNMIENVTWYLGGNSSSSGTTAQFYNYERGDTVYSGRPTSTKGYIGLMYPSDYGYSVLASSCVRTTDLVDYDSTTCAGESWMYGFSYEWLITPRTSSSILTFFLDSDGNLDYANPDDTYTIRPTLYLKDSVYVLDGDGSLINPYIIAI